MEVLNNQWLSIILIGTVVGIAVWLFNKLYNWVEKLTNTVGDLSSMVREMKVELDGEIERRRDSEKDIQELQTAVFKTPKVRYQKA